MIAVLVFFLLFAQVEVAAQEIPPAAEIPKTVSLDIKGMDIQEVLKLLSKQTGFNIVSGPDVKGRVSIYLEEVDIWEALTVIFETNQLAYEQRGNLIKVMTREQYLKEFGRPFQSVTENVKVQHVPLRSLEKMLNEMKSASGKIVFEERSGRVFITDTQERVNAIKNVIATVDLPLETRIFVLHYGDVGELKDKIKELLTPEVGHLEVDERTNRAVVSDLPSRLNAVEEMILVFDAQHREVMIKAKMIEVNLSDKLQHGINWQGLLEEAQNLKLVESFELAKKGAFTSGVELSAGVLNEDKQEGFLQMLSSLGETNILSEPTITVLNGEEAKILVGTNEAYVTQTVVQGQTTSTTAENVTFIDVGVKLFVVPEIHSDEYVSLKIKPEVSSVQKTIKTSVGNEIPVVQTSQAETKVLVKSGTTLLLGGLMQSRDSYTKEKIPLLGDVPILGLAFQRKIKEKRKTELILLLTPVITYGKEATVE